MIYADYNGSSPLLPSVREYVKKRMDSDLFANPNAIHTLSQKLSRGMEKCRSIIAEAIGCYPNQIFFNSGASEGISQILHSILEKSSKDKNIIITSEIEHAVVLNALSYYEKNKGFSVKFVKVNSDGVAQLDSLEELLQAHKGKISLVTLMAVNNETGVIQPYQEYAKICRSHDVVYFSDTTQLIGKADFNFNQSTLDYAVCSGHKLGAISGSGFMIVKEPTKLLPLVFGSIQEKGQRGGTQHYLGIETLAIAVKDFYENISKLEELEKAKLKFEEEIKKYFSDTVIVGSGASRLAGTTLVGYPGIHGQAVQIELESNDIIVTTSAACSDNQPETSRVLKAMGINDQLGRGVIRVSLSYNQGEKEYAALAENLKTAYNKLIKIKSF
jgi:cysteine desulfurase